MRYFIVSQQPDSAINYFLNQRLLHYLDKNQYVHGTDYVLDWRDDGRYGLKGLISYNSELDLILKLYNWSEKNEVFTDTN